MKELTIEEKAKQYNKALSVALETYQTQPMYKDWLEKMFPELKESDDERIRKAILELVKQSSEILEKKNQEQMIDWLEKQGQVRCTGGKKEETGALKKMLDLEKEMITPEESLGIDSETYNKIVDECIYGDEQKPTDEEIKELLRTEYEKGRADAIAEQKPAWSEDDENRINRLIAYFEDKESFTAEDDVVYANWLKSLKDRVQPQSQWKPTDEQMKILNEVLNFAANHESFHWNDNIFGTLNNLIRQLKKLKGE